MQLAFRSHTNIAAGKGGRQNGGRRPLTAIALLALLAALPGCSMLAALGSQGGENKNQPAAYPGLANKSVAIVIYVQPATINEYAGAREEISAFVSKDLRVNVPTAKIVNSQDVVAWQNDTINWDGLTEHDIGKHFSVDRVLYIEVLDYSTRRTLGYSDIQGHLRAQCKVVEVDNASPTPAWTGLVDVNWPKDRPLDPTQTNEDAVREQALQVFSRTLVGYFYDHPEHPADDNVDQ